MSKKTLGFGLGLAAIAVTGGLAAPIIGTSVFATVAVSTALAIGGGLLQASAARDAAKRAARRAASESVRGQAIESLVSGGDASHSLVFGRCRVGGVILNQFTRGQNNEVLELYVAHSITHAGGVQGVGTLYVNGLAIATTNDPVLTTSAGTGTETKIISSRPNGGDCFGLLGIRTYLGLHTQVIGGEFSSSAGNAMATDHARGIAWSCITLTRDLADDFRFQKAFGGSIPLITIEVLGLKCYDPRQDSTRGGSGTQRAELPLTWAYSDNPALCTLTYLLMRVTDGGCGRAIATIDYTSFAAAATACEVQINASPATAKYAVNGALSTEADCDDNLDRLVAAMQGCWFEEGGLIKVIAGVYQSPTATITDDWLAGPIDVVNGSGLDALYNAVRVVYKSPASNYEPLEAFPFTKATYSTEDGGKQIFRDLSASMCTNDYQAQYLGQVEGQKSRQQRSMNLVLKLHGLTLSVGQAVQLSLFVAPEIGGANVYLVTAKKYVVGGDGSLLIQVSLEEHRLDTYAVAAFNAPSTANSYPDIYETPTTPTFSSVTAVADGLALKWVPPAATAYTLVEAEVATAVGGPYTLIAGIKGDRLTYPSTTGTLLYFRVRAVNAQGQYSLYSAVISSAGKVVADGADVSANAVDTFVLNPGFEAGDKNWTKETGFTVVNEPANANTGTWVARHDGAGTAAIRNRAFGVSKGAAVVAAAWIKTAGTTNGTAAARITFFNAAGGEIQSVVGNAVSTGVFGQSRVVAVVPVGAASARIEGFVASKTVGLHYFDDFTASVVAADQRTAPPIATGGLRSAWVGQTITGSYDTASPATVTISVSAATLRVGDASITYSAMSFTDTQARGSTVTRYLYADDPTYAGGSQTLSATTEFGGLFTSNGRVFVGTITTVIPASGSGTGSGTGGGGSGGGGPILN